VGCGRRVKHWGGGGGLEGGKIRGRVGSAVHMEKKGGERSGVHLNFKKDNTLKVCV
jgi:hypothetical protein